MRVFALLTSAWRRIGERTRAYVANDDPLAEAANAGAFLVWSSQPLYPFQVWFLVGSAAGPAFLTWLSTPFFFGVPLLARRSPPAGRALFVVAGIVNTLIATKALGPRSAVGWFLVPCGLLVVAFFRQPEWRVALVLGALVVATAVGLSHVGAPIGTFSPGADRSLTRLHLVGAGVLSAYLLYLAWRARWRPAGA